MARRRTVEFQYDPSVIHLWLAPGSTSAMCLSTLPWEGNVWDVASGMKTVGINKSRKTAPRYDEQLAVDRNTWLDTTQESATVPQNADFNVESEIDLSADSFLVVLAEASPDTGVAKRKGKAEAEEKTAILSRTLFTSASSVLSSCYSYSPLGCLRDTK
ncbi:uncharacterized protein EDB91DRAFT_1336676 [Suillus paluster]|uniref:uncharacterized protein n=1 Tax=Suillus paluster TaxID=48578 RepID=UPI001B8732F9|nr:uncharacterized protein EDB91DRAFT_1336676 [Suillus paluster]KAG1739867.1 hypothetical protein EDB91DRAFT_1336676 [Suillus paluster]